MNNIEDLNNSKMFHPALDIKGDILVLGFRIRQKDDGEFDRYIVCKKDLVEITKSTEVKIDEDIITIDRKGRLLPKLSQRWSVEKLNAYLDSIGNLEYKKVSEAGLYAKIKSLLKKHIDLDDEADYLIVSAWIMATYFFPLMSAFPYLHFKAPKGSGKSQMLAFLKQLAFNAVKARVSYPALRDITDSQRGTFIMDQADILSKENMADILDLLTDSYKRGGGEQRKMIPTGRSWTPSEFETYGPKAFASINSLPEDLRDRCIIIPLVKSSNSYPLIDEENEVWLEVRDELYRLLIEKFKYVENIYQLKIAEYKQNPTITGRSLELWLPIETMLTVSAVSEEEINIAKKRFVVRYDFAGFIMSEVEVELIDTVSGMFDGKPEIILHPKTIAVEMRESVFRETGKNMPDDKQKAAAVGRSINDLNLATRRLKRDRNGERYLFTANRVKKIKDGYIEKMEDVDAPTVTSEKDIDNEEIFKNM